MKINGSLVFDASSASEIQNLRIQKYTGENVPAHTAADVGRAIYVTEAGGGYSANTLYIGGASSWVSLATGGNAAALQTEVDNIEVSLGAGIKTDGTFDATGFDAKFGTQLGGAPSSFTDAINKLATYADANNQLSELDDVTITSVQSGQYLKYNSTTSKWVNDTLQVADVTDLAASAAELNVLDGITASTAELNILDGVTAVAADINLLHGFAAALAGKSVSATEFGYLDGVTSAIQTQIDGKQAADADLTSLAALATTGIVVRSAADTFVTRSMTAPAAGLTITNPNGVSGSPTFALANDLAALEGLATTGMIIRTGDGAATTRSIDGTASNIVVTNGSGIDGNPSIDLAAVTQAASGSFVKVTLDGFGRVTGNTAVVTSDITALVNATYVNVSGDTMTGNLAMGSSYVTMNNAPTQDTHAVNKAYVDSVAAGLSWKQAVRAASTANVALAPAPAAIDGVTLANGNRVLLKNQTAAAENGIYVFDGTDLVRAADMNAAGEFAGATVFVTEGTANADTGWTQTAEVATVGTNSVTWVQFSGSALYTWGTGLGNSGNTIFVNLGAGVKELANDAVGLDIASGKAIQLTGTGLENGDQLTFVLHETSPGASGLEQSADGLRIKADSVTNAMLANKGITVAGTAGSDAVALGETLTFSSTVSGLVAAAVTDNAVALNVRLASTSATGVASFATGDFAVSVGGEVTIKTGGVDNAQLANSTITVAGTTGSDEVALGETLTFSSTVSGLVSSTVATNGIALDVRKATASETGVASFSSDFFSVTNGAVSLAATLDDLTNVSSADAAATGTLLTKTATDWQPVSRADVVASVTLDDIGDVALSLPADGEVLVRNGSNQWVNQKVYHLHTQSGTATEWSVTHNLGVKYCNVTVVDASDEVIIPQSITFDSTSALTVKFNTAIAGKVVVMGIA